MARLDTARGLAVETQLRASAQQTSLGTIAATWSPRAADFLRADLLVLPDERAAMSIRARDALDATLAVLNSDSAGLSLFSGTATDRRSMTDGATFMASVDAALAGAVDAADVVARLDAWFDTPGGGFETDAYLGSVDSLAPIPLGNGVDITLDLRADNERLRAGMKSLVKAIVATDPSLALSVSEQTSLLSEAGEGILAAQNGLSALQSQIGATEARIDGVTTRISAEISAVETLRLALIGTDPFDDASKLEAAQFQLESLYTVTLTARRMSFLEALR